MTFVTQEDNVERGRRAFFERLVALGPREVLDVGCGRGDTLLRLRGAGIAARGVDFERAADPVADDLDLGVASADDLPFEEGEFDWVCMRYVPHHLADPAAAFREALRVARRGFFVAEPWFDDSLACQRNARRLDAWTKRLDRMGGMVHEEVLDEEALRAALGESTSLAVTSELDFELRPRDPGPVFEQVEARLEKLPGADSERPAWSELRAAIEADGLSWNGSLFLTARRSVAGEQPVE